MGIIRTVNLDGSVRTIRDLEGVFADEAAWRMLDTVVYEVDMHDACGETEGGLFFGISHVRPGRVAHRLVNAAASAFFC